MGGGQLAGGAPHIENRAHGGDGYNPAIFAAGAAAGSFTALGALVILVVSRRQSRRTSLVVGRAELRIRKDVTSPNGRDGVAMPTGV